MSQSDSTSHEAFIAREKKAAPRIEPEPSQLGNSYTARPEISDGYSTGQATSDDSYTRPETSRPEISDNHYAQPVTARNMSPVPMYNIAEEMVWYEEKRGLWKQARMADIEMHA
jgi:hypothetical protein